MRAKGIIFFICVVMSTSCANRRAANERAEKAQQPIVFSDIVKHPQGVEAHGPRGFYISDYNPDTERGFIWRVVKNDVFPLYEGLKHPRGMTWDWRRAELHVADGDTIKIYKVRKNKINQPKVFEVPFVKKDAASKPYLDDIDFSLMNNRSYACDAKGGTVWELNPKKGTFLNFLTREDFEKLGFGGPKAVYVSSDGKHLYFSTDIEGWSQAKHPAILTYSLPKKKLSVLLARTEFSSLVGLEYFSNHLFVGERDKGEVWSVPLKNPDKAEIFSPLSQFSSLSAWALNDNQALMIGLDPKVDSSKLKFIPFGFMQQK